MMESEGVRLVVVSRQELEHLCIQHPGRPVAVLERAHKYSRVFAVAVLGAGVGALQEVLQFQKLTCPQTKFSILNLQERAVPRFQQQWSWS